MENHKKGLPLYIGIFAADPKTAIKVVKDNCKQAILDTLKQTKPQAYLSEGEHLDKKEKSFGIERDLMQEETIIIEKDFANFEAFNQPKDNYHITSLFIGKKRQNLNKKDKLLLANWENGVKELIKVDFIVYVPNHILAGYCSEVGKVQVSNTFPHMTLLLKQKASAVESNAVLQLLHDKCPQIFAQRQKKVTILDIPYGNLSKNIIVIDLSFEMEGLTGDNLTCGKK